MNDGSYAVANDGESSMMPDGFSTAEPSLSERSDNASHHGVAGAHTVAARLVAARTVLGMSAGDVALRTRITLRHVEALEAGDYTSMPGRPYAIGFARSYARAVGLNDVEIAEAVRQELQVRPSRPEPRVVAQFEVGDPAKSPSRLVGWLALLLVGGILAMGGIFWRSYYAPSVSLPALVTDSPQPAAQLTRSQANLPRAKPAPNAANGPVVFTALADGVWVKFYDGQGQQLMQKLLAKGESYTVPADATEPRLWTGRPDALAITVGGQPIPRLSEAERVMKDIPIDAASLRARPMSAPTVTPSQPTDGKTSRH